MDGFGERVKQLRMQHRMTRRDIARLAGLHEDHLSKVEQGTRKRVEADTIVGLARALSCTADYLLGLCTAEEDAAMLDIVMGRRPLHEDTP